MNPSKYLIGLYDVNCVKIELERLTKMQKWVSYYNFDVNQQDIIRIDLRQLVHGMKLEKRDFFKTPNPKAMVMRRTFAGIDFGDSNAPQIIEMNWEEVHARNTMFIHSLPSGEVRAVRMDRDGNILPDPPEPPPSRTRRG